EMLGPPALPAAILVAEGNKGTRGMLRNVLGAAGYRVIEAATVGEAADRIRVGGIDVAVMDAAIAEHVDAGGPGTITIVERVGDLSAEEKFLIARPVQPDAL